MWSSQLYTKLGKSQGISDEILEAAVQQIEAVIEPIPHPPALLTLKHFATRADVSYSSLRRFVSHDQKAYRHFYIRKRAGGARLIFVPEPELLKAQRWITEHLLNLIQVHRRSFAFSPGSSIVKCASKHCGAQWLIKFDVRDFFTSISEIQVYRVFRSLNYGRLVSFELSRICTFAPEMSPRYELGAWRNWHQSNIDFYEHKGIGYLPQGAPTSPMLSNLVMRELDEVLMLIGKEHGLVYTRYADDLTFSTKSTKYSRAQAKALQKKVQKCLVSEGLRLKATKTTITPPGSRKVVLGLLVDGVTPALPREFKSLLRQHFHYLEDDVAKHARKRQFDSISGMRRHIRGLIDFANMVDSSYASPLLHRFNEIDWP
ncbi:reverse transcriptase family protein [Terriglobus sp. RCC_193]|uniref:reverse transcriptase family protein n=1 Tax=Terriglobus sp. RCC_193 TaxID=3239218 RepID=UPI003524B169